MIISQLCFWIVVLFAGVVAYKFYHVSPSAGGRLRVLTIRLFAAIVFVFSLSGVHYLLYDFGLVGAITIYERILNSCIMLWATWGFWRHLS